MTQRSTTVGRVTRSVIAMVVLAGLCAGCGLGRPAVHPNDVDDARLERLAEDPLLAGGAATGARSPDTSANVTVQRGLVTRADPWDPPLTDDGSMVPGATLAEGRSLLAAVRDAGWTPIAVGCSFDRAGELGAARVFAVKDLGGFTAAMESHVSLRLSDLTAYAPFHEEDPNPWKPTTAVEPGESCLETAPAAGEDAPAPENITLPDDLNVARWY
jgi:hypothetical protein